MKGTRAGPSPFSESRRLVQGGNVWQLFITPKQSAQPAVRREVSETGFSPLQESVLLDTAKVVGEIPASRVVTWSVLSFISSVEMKLFLL